MEVAADPGGRSNSQTAKRISERWAAMHLYCFACSCDLLTPTKPNTPAVDFVCQECRSSYQLKCRARPSKCVPDGANKSMLNAIESDSVPNLIVLTYSRDWFVNDLLLVPSFFFSKSSIQARKPLSVTAKRAGWCGCNILLDRIPDEGKVTIVENRSVVNADRAREIYARLRPLASIPAAVRGWALDVLVVVNKIGRDRFSLSDVYAYEPELSKLYPSNNNLRAKIRQQLQVLRDTGIIQFLGNGKYLLLR